MAERFLDACYKGVLCKKKENSAVETGQFEAEFGNVKKGHSGSACHCLQKSPEAPWANASLCLSIGCSM